MDNITVDLVVGLSQTDAVPAHIRLRCFNDAKLLDVTMR